MLYIYVTVIAINGVSGCCPNGGVCMGREPNTINLPSPTTITLRDSELVYPLVLTMHCCPLSTYTSTSNNQIVSAATNNHPHDTLERPYPSWKSNNQFFSSRCPHNWSENWVLQTSSCEPSGSVESRISSSKNSFLPQGKSMFSGLFLEAELTRLDGLFKFYFPAFTTIELQHRLGSILQWWLTEHLFLQ